MGYLLETNGLCKHYHRAGSTVEVLRGVDFRLEPGGTAAIVGRSGSGKSTLLNILGGLDLPSAGRVLVDGAPLETARRREREHWRARGVGFVFQFHFLLPDFTALENLLVPVGGLGPVGPADRRRALTLLEAMGLGDRAGHLPGELSGGEQQRVAVARAFMNRPRVVLADEPFGNLDREIGERLGDLLFTLHRQEDVALVLVTHDPALAARAQACWRLEQGVLVADAQEVAPT
ncbi:MAG: ABC transporter ATP-binding protein [bacterium]|nr:ABC transporter ATP-binding protein [bacterium]